jgi:diacylglycerol kinase (ATP)
MQVKTFRVKKVARGRAGDLRNADTGQGQAAPRSHGDAADVEGGAETMAEFLLDPGLCPLRLHIQVNDYERDCGDAEQHSQKPQCNTRETAHARTLRRPTFKKRTIPFPVVLSETIVILNPAAHSDRGKRWRARVESLARGCTVCASSRAGDAELLARNAAREGFKKIVAAGGDGTINEVVNGLAGSTATLGLLPIGTVNVFASELGLPIHNLQMCWNIIEGDKTRVIDLPRANKKYFVQLAGVGLDAQVVKETSLALKRNFGPLSYLISAAQIAARRPPLLYLESKDAPTNEASFVLIGNGRRYGGPFPFFKQAQLDDGLLDVVAFKQVGYLEIIKYLQDVFFSSEIRLPEVEYFQTQRLRISSDQDVPVELDGEVVGNCPVEFELLEHRLRVLAPPLAA